MLMNSIGIFVTELVKNGRDFVVIPRSNEFSDQTLKPSRLLVTKSTRQKGGRGRMKDRL